MSTAEPLSLYETDIKKEWLDYNDHLNVANYVLIFDEAGVALFDHFGMGEAYSMETGGSWVVLENHITYDQELRLGESVKVTSQIIDYDAKRLHLYHEIHKIGDESGRPSSTCEQMTMFFDLNERRSTAFPGHVMAKITHYGEAHSRLKTPTNLSRIIGLPKKNPN